MIRRRAVGRLAAVSVFLAVALGGERITGPADPPAVAPSATQLLPPGSIVKHAHLVGGGFVRGLDIAQDASGLQVLGPRGWRTFPTLRLAGEVAGLRLWLGTDHQGRSLLARAVRGARTSLIVALLATIVAIVLGTLVGLTAATAPSRLSAVLTVGTDGLIGMPRLLLLLMLGVILRGSPAGIGLAVGLASWMEVSRLVEAEARAAMKRPYLVAARAAGAGPLRTALMHLMPGLGPILSVSAPLVATRAVLIESTLAFLGVSGGTGASWGRMVADGHRLLPQGWWLVVFPGILLCATALVIHGLIPAARSRSASPSSA